jgi:excisionase family DNA binding protein
METDRTLLLSPDDACRHLGISRASLWKLMGSGEIASFKIGKLRRIPLAGLEAWVERQVARAAAETAGQGPATPQGGW